MVSDTKLDQQELNGETTVSSDVISHSKENADSQTASVTATAIEGHAGECVWLIDLKLDLNIC